MRIREIDVNSNYLPVPDACRFFNLGRNTILRLAQESGAKIDIGKHCTRINVSKLSAYIEDNFS